MYCMHTDELKEFQENLFNMVNQRLTKLGMKNSAPFLLVLCHSPFLNPDEVGSNNGIKKKLNADEERIKDMMLDGTFIFLY